MGRLVFYSSLPCGKAKQIVPALFSKNQWDDCEFQKNYDFKYIIMHLRISKCGLILLLSITALKLPGAEQAVSKDRPNILLILSDDHSFPHVGCYNDVNVLKYNITPNLDAFARQGIRFDRAYTTSPQCAPSRISIFTGCSPVSIGVTRFYEPSRKEVPFFSDILRESGYWVGLAGRPHHLDGPPASVDPFIYDVLKKEGMVYAESRFDLVSQFSTKGEGLKMVSQKFDAILDKVPKGKPFFLYFGFSQPHRRFENNYEEINPDQLVLPPDFVDLPEIRKDYARYLSDVRDMDLGFGSIMKALEERKLTKNTIVIFIGDNGESLLRGKGTVHGRGIHVPLIIRYPGVTKPNSSTKTLVSGEDLAPTILDLVGLNFRTAINGTSFGNTIKGVEENKQREFVFAERGYHNGPLTRTDGYDLSRSVTSERYHLIYNALPKQEFVQVDMVKANAWNDLVKANSENILSHRHQDFYFYKERPIFELYDLQNDPFELTNLSGQPKLAATEQRLKNEMEQKMVVDHDFLPMPSHALKIGNEKKEK